MRHENSAAHLADLRAGVKAKQAIVDKALANLGRYDKHRGAHGAVDNPRFGDGAMASFLEHAAANAELGRLQAQIMHHPLTQSDTAFNGDGSPCNEREAALAEAARAMVNEGELPDSFREFRSENTDPAGRRGLRIEFTKMAAVRSDNATGEEAVPTGVYPELWNELKYLGSVASMSAEITTANGQPNNWLRTDDSAQTGEWLAQDTAGTSQDLPQIYRMLLSPQRVSSKAMAISREMIRDSAFDVAAFVARAGIRRIANASEVAFTSGAGTGTPPLPAGVQTVATAGVTAASATDVTREEVLSLVGEIDYAYLVQNDGSQPGPGARPPVSGTTGFMFSRELLTKLINLDIDARNLSFDPAGREGTWARWRNWPFSVNPQLGDLTTGKVPCLFGAFEGYIVRNVGSVEILPWPDYDKNVVTYRVFGYRDAAPWWGVADSDRTSASKAIVKLTMG